MSKGREREPSLATPFVGRESELSQLGRLLADPRERLVTILGPGGAGKTRLALEAARRFGGDPTIFPNGAVWVPLAGVSDSSLVTPAIAGALTSPAMAGALASPAMASSLGAAYAGRPESWDDLKGFLAHRCLLLVLDNFEHLLDAATLVADLLADAPGVKILATSREKLDLSLETRLRLEGLSFTTSGRAPASDATSSATLFLLGARRARPGYEPGEVDLAAIDDIGRLVEGLPLALLLAAAWMDSLAPGEILAEIRRSLDFLSARWPDVPPRHRSLRAVFDSDWARLDQDERRVHKCLAVFRGGFTHEAVEAVADSAAPGAHLNSLLILNGLVAKGLLRREATGRYELHEVARQYAREKLEEQPGEIDTVLDRHQAHYLAWLASLQPALEGPGQVEALDAIAADFENVRLAWARGVQAGDHEGIDQARDALYEYCDMRTRNQAGESLFRLVREAWSGAGVKAPPAAAELQPAWARCLLPWYDMFVQSVGPLPQEAVGPLRAEAERGLETARRAGDMVTSAFCSSLLGELAGKAGEHGRAVELFQAAMEQHVAMDDAYWVRLRLGLSLRELGRPAEAITWFGRALDRGRQLGEKIKMGWALTNTAETQMLLGLPAPAAQALEEARAMFVAVGNPMGQVWTMADLSQIALLRGDPEAALDLAARARTLAETSHYHLGGWRQALISLARAAQALGDESQAAEAIDILRREFPEAIESARVAPAVGDPSGILTAREREVLALIAEGCSNETIARRLVVSLATVKTHLIHIYGKLDARSRTQAVARARELGLL